MLKTVMLPNTVVEILIESSKEQHLFEIEIFCNIINVFTLAVTFLNVSLLNESNIFLFIHPKLLNGSVSWFPQKYLIFYFP